MSVTSALEDRQISEWEIIIVTHKKTIYSLSRIIDAYGK